MLNYWENTLYPQFLNTIDSCTLSEQANLFIQEQLNDLAIKSIADFKFPKVSLSYLYDETTNTETDAPYGYYFIETNVGQQELNVILARMKAYWVEYQISREKMFENTYYDRDIKLHSPGNFLDKLLKLYATFETKADRAEYNYYRVNIEKNPSIGDVNV